MPEASHESSPLGSGGMPRVGRSDDCLLCRDEQVRQGVVLDTISKRQEETLDRLNRMTSIVYGGNGHTRDSLLIRMDAAEKQIEELREVKATGSTASRQLITAVVAAMVGAVTSGTIVHFLTAVPH